MVGSLVGGEVGGSGGGGRGCGGPGGGEGTGFWGEGRFLGCRSIACYENFR